MARRRNYTTGQLIGFIERYIEYKKDFSKVTPSAVARYCQEVLHQFPVITYQTFTRNAEALAYIDKYNDALAQHMAAERDDSDPMAVVTSLIDVDKLGSHRSEILDKIREVNKRLESMYQLVGTYARQAQKAQKDLESAAEELEGFQETVKKQETIIKDLKKELSAARKELKVEKSKIQAMIKFFELYLYGPVIDQHMDVIGWTDGKTNRNRTFPVIGIKAADADLIAAVKDFYDTVIQPESDTEKEKEKEETPPVEVLPAEPDVVIQDPGTKRRKDLLSRINNL